MPIRDMTRLMEVLCGVAFALMACAVFFTVRHWIVYPIVATFGGLAIGTFTRVLGQAAWNRMRNRKQSSPETENGIATSNLREEETGKKTCQDDFSGE